MSIRNLEHLFHPRSVAVIGASITPRSVGATVLANLIEAKFSGTLMAVNPRYAELSGIPVHPTVSSLPEAPELAVICTPPAAIPELIAELGQCGCRAAIVLTAGLGAARVPDGRSVKEAMLEAAKPFLLRILGPNCVGLLIPPLGLNASFAHTSAPAGRIAFVSQSGALVTAVLDWAKSRGIGFSKFISLGDSADVDAGDVLDYLAGDPQTDSILLYLEAFSSARKFMSAARAAARNKPVVIVKAGRAPEGAKAAASHTGALAGSDDVSDAAIRRAGMLRVSSTDELFDAVETLSRARPLVSETLTIMTNGGGPGVMATDALIAADGALSVLPAEVIARLDAVLPPTWSHANPVDIIGDAPAERYVNALNVLLDQPLPPTVLFIHAPTAIEPSAGIASALAPVITAARRNVLSCWLGGDAVRRARDLFEAEGLPVYDTPEDGVSAFLQMVRYRRSQALLREVPPSRPSGSAEFAHDAGKAKSVIDAVLAGGRTLLTEIEAKAVLAAYSIPVVPTRTAGSAADAVRMATAVGFPVALKILSPDITHKSDVGGVALDLRDASAVESAAATMLARVAQDAPKARIAGFTVQQMVRRPHARELIVGVSTDPVFGPVVLFGQGGTAVEVVADKAIALPPLNMVLARDLIGRTRVAKLLRAYRDFPAADVEAVCSTLIKVAHLIADIPQIAELDINPLLADDDGVVALDARIAVGRSATMGVDRFAIRPYPEELEETLDWDGRKVMLRPIRPEDGAQHLEFFESLDPDDVRLRMFSPIREVSASQLARFTQIDYDREMAFIATTTTGRATGECAQTLGVARAISDPDNVEAEFAIIVRSDLKGSGLGAILMRKLIDYCRGRGTSRLIGEALPENRRMLALARDCGFEVGNADTGVVRMKLEL